MPVVEIADLAAPRLADYSHLMDVALKKAQGTEHGRYIADSALVLERALTSRRSRSRWAIHQSGDGVAGRNSGQEATCVPLATPGTIPS